MPDPSTPPLTPHDDSLSLKPSPRTDESEGPVMTTRTDVWILPAALSMFVTLPSRADPNHCDPVLTIETGAHTAAIEHISSDGRYLVSGSRDKTVRIWSMTTGALEATLRPPLGAGNEGKIFAVALSPDGKTVAAAGWTTSPDKSYSVYLFDRESRRYLRRIPGHSDIIYNLRFSPDGAQVAAVQRKGGLRISQVSDGRLLFADSITTSDRTGIDFDRSGRLATSSVDGYVQLYDQSRQVLAKQQTQGAQEVYSVRFSPDGRKIAVGYWNVARVDVLSGQNLHLLYQPDLRGVTAQRLPAVSWSLDGSRLCAAGSWLVTGESMIRCWSAAGRGVAQNSSASADSISDLIALPGGRLAFGAADPAWGVLDKQGTRVQFQPSPTADFRDNVRGLLVDQDGGQVRFSYAARGQHPATFDVSTRTLTLNPAEDQRLNAPRTAGIDVQGWEGTDRTKLNDKPLVRPSEFSRSLAVSPDGSWFVLGTDRYLRCYDRAGVLRWVVPAPGETLAVNISGDGRLAVAAFKDGTIRWYRSTAGAELLALFPHGDRRRWVAWTPPGYFDASQSGKVLVGWVFSRGHDAASEFSPTPPSVHAHAPAIISSALRLDKPAPLPATHTTSPPMGPNGASAEGRPVGVSLQLAVHWPLGWPVLQWATSIPMDWLTRLFPASGLLLQSVTAQRSQPPTLTATAGQ